MASREEFIDSEGMLRAELAGYQEHKPLLSRQGLALQEQRDQTESLEASLRKLSKEYEYS